MAKFIIGFAALLLYHKISSTSCAKFQINDHTIQLIDNYLNSEMYLKAHTSNQAVLILFTNFDKSGDALVDDFFEKWDKKIKYQTIKVVMLDHSKDTKSLQDFITTYDWTASCIVMFMDDFVKVRIS
jgi:hypothetical protein